MSPCAVGMRLRILSCSPADDDDNDANGDGDTTDDDDDEEGTNSQQTTVRHDEVRSCGRCPRCSCAHPRALCFPVTVSEHSKVRDC